MFFPFFVTLEFAFYVGWLKVAETLINPFGEDDDDFELNRLLDRHIQVGYMICDPTVQKPDLLKDKFWESVIPKEMLYSVGSDGYGKILSPEFRGSAEVALDDKLEGTETGYGETAHLGTREEVSEAVTESKEAPSGSAAILASSSCSCCRALTNAAFNLLVCSALRAFLTLDVTHCSQITRTSFPANTTFIRIVQLSKVKDCKCC